MWWMPSMGRTGSSPRCPGKLARASIAITTCARKQYRGRTRDPPRRRTGAGRGSPSERLGRFDREDGRMAARQQRVRHAAAEQAAEPALGARAGDDEVIAALVGELREDLAGAAVEQPGGDRHRRRDVVAGGGELLLHLALEVAQQALARERHGGRADRRPHARLLDHARDREQCTLAHGDGDAAVERGPRARRAVKGDEHAPDGPAVGAGRRNEARARAGAARGGRKGRRARGGWPGEGGGQANGGEGGVGPALHPPAGGEGWARPRQSRTKNVSLQDGLFTSTVSV